MSTALRGGRRLALLASQAWSAATRHPLDVSSARIFFIFGHRYARLALSPAAQQWINVVLIWVGFGTLVGLLATVIFPFRRPVGPFWAMVIGHCRQHGRPARAELALSRPRHRIPSVRWASWPPRSAPSCCWCSTASAAPCSASRQTTPTSEGCRQLAESGLSRIRSAGDIACVPSCRRALLHSVAIRPCRRLAAVRRCIEALATVRQSTRY